MYFLLLLIGGLVAVSCERLDENGYHYDKPARPFELPNVDLLTESYDESQPELVHFEIIQKVKSTEPTREYLPVAIESEPKNDKKATKEETYLEPYEPLKSYASSKDSSAADEEAQLNQARQIDSETKEDASFEASIQSANDSRVFSSSFKNQQSELKYLPPLSSPPIDEHYFPNFDVSSKQSTETQHQLVSVEKPTNVAAVATNKDLSEYQNIYTTTSTSSASVQQQKQPKRINLNLILESMSRTEKPSSQYLPPTADAINQATLKATLNTLISNTNSPLAADGFVSFDAETAGDFKYSGLNRFAPTTAKPILQQNKQQQFNSQVKTQSADVVASTKPSHGNNFQLTTQTTLQNQNSYFPLVEFPKPTTQQFTANNYQTKQPFELTTPKPNLNAYQFKANPPTSTTASTFDFYARTANFENLSRTYLPAGLSSPLNSPHINYEKPSSLYLPVPTIQPLTYLPPSNTYLPAVRPTLATIFTIEATRSFLPRQYLPAALNTNSPIYTKIQTITSDIQHSIPSFLSKQGEALHFSESARTYLPPLQNQRPTFASILENIRKLSTKELSFLPGPLPIPTPMISLNNNFGDGFYAITNSKTTSPAKIATSKLTSTDDRNPNQFQTEYRQSNAKAALMNERKILKPISEQPAPEHLPDTASTRTDGTENEDEFFIFIKKDRRLNMPQTVALSPQKFSDTSRITLEDVEVPTSHLEGYHYEMPEKIFIT